MPAPFEVTAFRAESEIQQYFQERGADKLSFPVESIYFDTQQGSFTSRWRNRIAERFTHREPRIVPFYERLKPFKIIQTWELFTDWSAQALEAKKHWKTPLCVMVWDNIPFNMERNPQRRELKRRMAGAADRFIVHSTRSRRTLDFEGVDPHKVVMLNPGVDTECFAPGPADRAALGLEPDDYVILFVGWLLPRKGIDFLLLALRELLHDETLRHKRIRLLVVGSGPGKDRVEKLIKRLNIEDACVFTGAVPYDRMPDAYRAANAFVLPSIATPEWQEQFGMSLLEAMSCGVPVVSTYTGAVPEIIGDAGLLCQPNDFVSLYEVLKNLALNPDRADELSHKGRERVCREFSLEQYTDALVEVYTDVLRRLG